ncbi:DNA repair protein RecO [Larkinella rosea]|uniref:DNA repair protein RecO n=1 Tax=Larkinella rosea TaxID=2025312 RepID=A0A3P1BFL8_9BACT|nr:DNA repair protein RecO [Larkinella rosea]RRA99834.1 DNA repair protein RecO [Larkinella rosea]
MLHKTRGIVLSYFRYRETSVIVRIYTEEFGLQSYLVNGVRSAKSKTNRIAFFQPLTLLDMVVYYKPGKDLNRLSEVKINHPLQHLPFDIAKSSMALFVSEMLTKTLKEEASNPSLYYFLVDSILYLEEAESDYENFHIAFFLKLAFFLGFGPSNAREFEEQLQEQKYPFLPDEAAERALNHFLRQPLASHIKISRQTRAELLDALVAFYHIHMDSLGEIKSLAVLREVLS